jgi:hypothetical protein
MSQRLRAVAPVRKALPGISLSDGMDVVKR